MVTFLIAPDDSPLATDIEGVLRHTSESVVRIASLDQYPAAIRDGERNLVVVIGDTSQNNIDATIAFAETNARAVYVIHISDDIPAVDFRRLLNTRAAEWIATGNAVAEIVGVIASSPLGAAADGSSRSANFIAFVPAGGGVGNTTLTAESAIFHASRNKSKQPACCILDLNLQQGNVCDLLDLTPHLDLEAFAHDPSRLDYKLLESFRSRSEHGVDVFALPKFPAMTEVSPPAIFALCNLLSERYARVHVDFPSYLHPWMIDIIQGSDRIVISTIFSVPGALRVQALRNELRGMDANNVCVVVNRFQNNIFKKSISRQSFESSIEGEIFIYINDDHAFALECANVGTPMMVAEPKRRLSKDIQQLERFIDPSIVRTGLLGRAFSRFGLGT